MKWHAWNFVISSCAAWDATRCHMHHIQAYHVLFASQAAQEFITKFQACHFMHLCVAAAMPFILRHMMQAYHILFASQAMHALVAKSHACPFIHSSPNNCQQEHEHLLAQACNGKSHLFLHCCRLHQGAGDHIIVLHIPAGHAGNAHEILL